MLAQMSTRPLGRISAGAAPFALASATALSLLQRVPPHVHVVLRDGVNIMTLQNFTALWLVASLLAILGRWGAARALALAATAVDIAMLVLFHDQIGKGSFPLFIWCGAALGLITLATPADLVDRSWSGRAEAAAICAVLYFGVTAFRDMGGPLHNLWLPWPVIVLALAFAAHLAQPGSDRLRAGGFVLVAVPWATVCDPWPWHTQPTIQLVGAGLTAVLFTCAGLGAGLARAIRARGVQDDELSTKALVTR